VSNRRTRGSKKLKIQKGTYVPFEYIGSRGKQRGGGGGSRKGKEEAARAKSFFGPWEGIKRRRRLVERGSLVRCLVDDHRIIAGRGKGKKPPGGEKSVRTAERITVGHRP